MEKAKGKRGGPQPGSGRPKLPPEQKKNRAVYWLTDEEKLSLDRTLEKIRMKTIETTEPIDVLVYSDRHIAKATPHFLEGGYPEAISLMLSWSNCNYDSSINDRDGMQRWIKDDPSEVPAEAVALYEAGAEYVNSFYGGDWRAMSAKDTALELAGIAADAGRIELMSRKAYLEEHGKYTLTVNSEDVNGNGDGDVFDTAVGLDAAKQMLENLTWADCEDNCINNLADVVAFHALLEDEDFNQVDSRRIERP